MIPLEAMSTRPYRPSEVSLRLDLKTSLISAMIFFGVATVSAAALDDPPDRASLSTERSSSAVYPSHAALIEGLATGLPSGAWRSVTQQGFATPGDGGAATYDWSLAATSPADGLFSIAPPTGEHGRYTLRIPALGVHPEVAGAMGYTASQQWDANGQPIAGFVPPDDTAALNRLSVALQVLGGGTILASQDRFYNVTGDLTIWRRVSFVCAGSPQAATGPDPVYFTTGITHPPDAHLILSYNTKLAHCTVMRTGQPQKPATMERWYAAVMSWQAETGEAVRIAGNDAQVEDTVLLGFHMGLFSEGSSRYRVHYVKVDDANGAYFGGTHDTGIVEHLNGNNTWAGNFDGHASTVRASLVSVGAGAMSRGVHLLAVVGGTCATQPMLRVAGGPGGTPEVAVADVGDCTKPPPNPVLIAGTQATFNLDWVSSSWRPGTGLDIDGTVGSTEGLYADAPRFEAWATGIHIRNAFGVTLDNPFLEGDPYAAGWQSQTGIKVEDCASNIEIKSPYVHEYAYDLWLHPRDRAHGGACGAFVGEDASVSVIGGSVAGNARAPVTKANGAVSTIDIGPFAVVSVTSTRIGSDSGLIRVGPDALDVSLINPAPITGFSVAAMLRIDPSSAGNTSVLAKGVLQLPHLPTSSAGLQSGSVWNSGGLLHVVP